MDSSILLTGLLVFAARVADVTMGTMRTISIVNGRQWLAFVLGIVEISLWLAVISTVIPRVAQHPLLGVFYALGFATGNVVGITAERHLAFGHIILRVMCHKAPKELAAAIRQQGFGVTAFQGEGMLGPVTELYVVCRRRDLKALLDVVNRLEPEAFYITAPAGSVSKMLRPGLPLPTGWRAEGKKK